MLPVRVLAQEPQQPVAVAPEEGEAIPCRIERHVLQQPLRAGLHRQAVLGYRPHPLRRALVDGEAGHPVGDRRHDLHRRGAGADDRHAFSVELEIVRPRGRVKERPGENVRTLDWRDRGPLEVAGGGDQHLRLDLRGSLRRTYRRRSSDCLPRSTPHPSPHSRSGCSGARRKMWRSPPHRPATRRAARSNVSSRGSAQTSTSRNGSAYRRRSRDSGSRTRCRRPRDCARRWCTARRAFPVCSRAPAPTGRRRR